MFRHIMTNGNNKLNLKESAMATSINEDTGFCSGEDYIEHELHSPTDSSEDSVEVKVSAITLKHNKRKFVETTRKETTFSGPLKKRMCLKVKAETNDGMTSLGKTPFRPWSPPRSKTPNLPTPTVPVASSNFAVPFPIKVESSNYSTVKPEISAFSYFRPPSPINITQQTEPVSLVIKCEKDDSLNPKVSDVRVPIHPQIAKLSTAETERMILKTNGQFPGLQEKTVCPSSVLASCNHNSNSSSNIKKSEQKREQRNYKNMTRERRVEANARERTRVHTISAAFDTLRQAVPSYSHNQKLSKLSVLRIACSYIMTLSSLVHDEARGEDSEKSTPACVDLVSRTIQREGKLRKKKDDND